LESKREVRFQVWPESQKYWRTFQNRKESPEVLAYLKTNLKDLATHYHAQYQNANEANEKAHELSRGQASGTAAYLESFPKEV